MLFNKYQYKIKTLSELQETIGAFPRHRKVVMCHGVFDVVHPGHVRHLAYAKSKADILVASITADRFINKGVYRPLVPQDLRAANLAAFEMVDYVIIDKLPKPLELVSVLKPDFFAKGYEYVLHEESSKTGEEEQIVLSYGGKMLFTPGDVVYSSSAFIEAAPPFLRDDKLLTLMHSYQIDFETLKDSLAEIKGLRVHVVGDTIIDGITQGAMIGGQTKTPTISVLYQSQKNYIGGAAIVAQHLQAAGANVTLTTLLGNDALKDFVLKQLEQSGVLVNAVIDDGRPTTYKNAIVVNGYRLIKLDKLDNSSVNNNLLNKFISSIETTQCDMVIFSDFRHGIFNRRTIPSLVDAIPESCFKVADSQVASRWGNITEFNGFDLVTPNEREARFVLADQDSGIRPLASELFGRINCKTLILKLGEKGILACLDDSHDSLESFIVLDSFVEKLKDPVGAGDALLAYAAMPLAIGKNPAIASILGSLAAACECEVEGNIPIRLDDLLSKIDLLKKRVAFLDEASDVVNFEVKHNI